MVFIATFNNISVISWQSVLLVEKTTDLSQVTDKLAINTINQNQQHFKKKIIYVCEAQLYRNQWKLKILYPFDGLI
jgi:ferredoxin-like protein FixX